MPRSITSVFSEAEDFAVAMREEGCLALLVTGAGQFRAQLTQVALQSLRLSATVEHLPRIAFVALPADTILVSLPRGRGAAPVWGGNTIGEGEIMTLGAGQRLHMRTDGPCRWGSIWVPAAELAEYGSVLTGVAFSVPSAARRWRPRPVMMRHLRHLHSAAIGLVERRSRAVIDAAAAHGLEQQLIDTLVECLSKSSAIEAAPATGEHRDVFFYYSGATPSAVRYKNWKMYYNMAQPGAEGWILPLIPFHFTLVDDIKRDPFEQADGVSEKTANGIGGALGGPVTAFVYDWNMLPIGQQLWEKELRSYQTFPPLQAPETYNLVGILDAMKKAGHPSD